jgi:hypothetical protein
MIWIYADVITNNPKFYLEMCEYEMVETVSNSEEGAGAKRTH